MKCCPAMLVLFKYSFQLPLEPFSFYNHFVFRAIRAFIGCIFKYLNYIPIMISGLRKKMLNAANEAFHKRNQPTGISSGSKTF